MIARLLCWFQGHNWVFYKSPQQAEWVDDLFLLPVCRVCTKCWKHDC